MKLFERLIYAVGVAVLVLLMVGLFQNYLNNPLRGCVYDSENEYYTRYVCDDGAAYKQKTYPEPRTSDLSVVTVNYAGLELPRYLNGQAIGEDFLQSSSESASLAQW